VGHPTARPLPYFCVTLARPKPALESASRKERRTRREAGVTPQQGPASRFNSVENNCIPTQIFCVAPYRRAP